MPPSHEQIGPSVVVIVRHRATVRVEPGHLESRFLGYVLELSAAQVLVELAWLTLDVFFVLAVERSAAAEEFQNGVVAGILAVLVGEDDAGLLGDVLKQTRRRFVAVLGRRFNRIL